MFETSTRISDVAACNDTSVEPGGAPPGLGRRRFIQAMGAAAAAGTLGATLPVGAVGALAAGASRFVPLTQVVRVLDTREPSKYDFSVVGTNQVRVALAGLHGVSSDATAVVATLTAVNESGPNWVTIVPSGVSVQTLLDENRLVSMLNMSADGQATANLTQVMLGAGGVDIASRVPCAMVFDVIGYYRPVTAAVREGRYVGLGAAVRAIDTRTTIGEVASGSSLDVDLTSFVPADASSVVVNLTATECTGPGYFTAYPYSAAAVPTASSLNVNGVGETRAAAVIVPVETLANGRRFMKVYARSAAKLIVDVTGYFTGPTSASSSAGLFVPADPERILDTREPGQIGRLWPRWIVEGTVPGAGASSGGSAVVNLTGVDSRGPGYLTIAPARLAVPDTSNLNFTGPLQVVPNHAITPIAASFGYQVYSSGGAHVIVDYMGYYTGSPATGTNPPPTNPPPPPIAPEWTLTIPKIGLTSRVLEGNGIVITNSGHSWHWEGTGFIGEDKHVASFAHRTTHGGPYRNLHYLVPGDEFTLTTLDRRIYTYRVVRRDLTNGNVQNILNATRLHPGTTFSLIACSRTNFTPTSTSYRIVVTGELIGWSEF